MHTYLQNNMLYVINTYNFYWSTKKEVSIFTNRNLGCALDDKAMTSVFRFKNKRVTNQNELSLQKAFQDLAANGTHLTVLKCQTSALQLIDQYLWIWGNLNCSKWSSVHDKTQGCPRLWRSPPYQKASEQTLKICLKSRLSSQKSHSNHVKLLIRTIL